MANERTYDGMTIYEQKRNAWAYLENKIAHGEITEAEAKAQLEKSRRQGVSTQTKVGHTPGPLAVEGANVRDRKGHTVAIAYDPNDPQHMTEVAEANARLIAAAPEMLEALRRADESGQLRDCLVETVVRAAIAKAEGR